MINKLIENIREIANGTLAFPPENGEQLEKFLIVWYCNKYNIPVTSGAAQELEFETLLLEFYLSNRWKEIEADIKSGKYEIEAQAKADEAWAKEMMGDDYEEEIDYLQEPTKREKEGRAPNLPDIDEDFSALGGVYEYGDE